MRKGKNLQRKLMLLVKRAFCVFDGLTHPLKAEVAHVSQYEKNEEERKELHQETGIFHIQSHFYFYCHTIFISISQ